MRKGKLFYAGMLIVGSCVAASVFFYSKSLVVNRQIAESVSNLEPNGAIGLKAIPVDFEGDKQNEMVLVYKVTDPGDEKKQIQKLRVMKRTESGWTDVVTQSFGVSDTKNEGVQGVQRIDFEGDGTVALFIQLHEKGQLKYALIAYDEMAGFQWNPMPALAASEQLGSATVSHEGISETIKTGCAGTVCGGIRNATVTLSQSRLIRK